MRHKVRESRARRILLEAKQGLLQVGARGARLESVRLNARRVGGRERVEEKRADISRALLTQIHVGMRSQRATRENMVFSYDFFSLLVKMYGYLLKCHMIMVKT